jgi:hypothetical protein
MSCAAAIIRSTVLMTALPSPLSANAEPATARQELTVPVGQDNGTYPVWHVNHPLLRHKLQNSAVRPFRHFLVLNFEQHWVVDVERG